jgi:DNA-binding GntR family transcriptional regulator
VVRLEPAARSKPAAAKAVAPRRRRPTGQHGFRLAAKALSQNEIAYQRIRESVITLRLPPGEALNAAALADSLGLGRTPVNRALQRLMTEGLIRILPRKGVVVAPLSLDEAVSLIEVRRVMEGHCLELAAQRITDAEIQELANCLARYRAAANGRRIAALLQADRAFHECIALASRNQVLGDMLKVLHARSQRFWAVSLSRQRHIDEADHEHIEILEALRARDAARARKAVEFHIESFRASLTNARTVAIQA